MRTMAVVLALMLTGGCAALQNSLVPAAQETAQMLDEKAIALQATGYALCDDPASVTPDMEANFKADLDAQCRATYLMNLLVRNEGYSWGDFVLGDVAEQ